MILICPENEVAEGFEKRAEVFFQKPSYEYCGYPVFL